MGAAGAAAGDPVYVDDVYSIDLHKGTSNNKTITNGIDLATEGGLVWNKGRSNNSANWLYDTEKGVNSGLRTNTNDGSNSSSDHFHSFNSDGYTLGSNGSLNYTGSTYVAWTFRKCPGFFDIVTYTGNGTAGREIPHSLGSTPGMVIVKRTNGADNWTVQHRSLGGTKSLYLNLTNTEDTSSTEWNNTAATSTVFTVGTSGKTNANGDTYVAYIFAHDDQSFGTSRNESIIKCGTYSGSTSTFQIDLGWEPQYVMIKRASGSSSAWTNWGIFDNMRGVVFGGNDNVVAANVNNEENGTNLYGSYNLIEFNSTGMKIDPTAGQATTVNTNGESYIYMAIRRPHKPPTAGTQVFDDVAYTGNSGVQDIAISPSYVDTNIIKRRTATDNWGWSNRFTGDSHHYTPNSTAAMASRNSADNVEFDRMNAFGLVGNSSGEVNYNGAPLISYNFKRAPGFFDYVSYTGDGTLNRNITHNLAAVPEMVIIKRKTLGEWWVDVDAAGSGQVLYLNRDNAKFSYTAFGTHTATTIQLESAANNDTNQNTGEYMAYLFATLAGVSKVGTYTGNGSFQDINCGFTTGARFVMTKRIDSTGGWVIYDTARGLGSGNDKYIRLDSNATELTYDDIDQQNAGFTIRNGSGVSNINGATYIFLAIA